MSSQSPKSSQSPASSPPDFDEARATAVEPYRHAATGRTVSFHQPAEEGAVALFSATGLWVATEVAPAAAQ